MTQSLPSFFTTIQPQETQFEPLAQYCQSIGMKFALVPTGFELTPPQMNSSDDDADEYDEFEDKEEGEIESTSLSDEDELDSWG